MMKLSESGLSFIKAREGLRLVSYQDQGGVWTIGYGSTVDVEPGERITEVEAGERLKEDVRHAENCVNQLVTVPLAEHEFDALVSFVFNVGCHAFRKSTLLRRLNGGEHDAVPSELGRWDKVNGEVVAGLTKRRKLEGDLWENVS